MDAKKWLPLLVGEEHQYPSVLCAADTRQCIAFRGINRGPLHLRELRTVRLSLRSTEVLSMVLWPSIVWFLGNLSWYCVPVTAFHERTNTSLGLSPGSNLR